MASATLCVSPIQPPVLSYSTCHSKPLLFNTKKGIKLRFKNINLNLKKPKQTTNQQSKANDKETLC